MELELELSSTSPWLEGWEFLHLLLPLRHRPTHTRSNNTFRTVTITTLISVLPPRNDNIPYQHDVRHQRRESTGERRVAAENGVDGEEVASYWGGDHEECEDKQGAEDGGGDEGGCVAWSGVGLDGFFGR